MAFKPVTFTPDEYEASQERSSYNEGWMAVVTSDATVETSKDKDDLEVSPNWEMLKFKVTPLSDPDDSSSTVGRGQFSYNCLPLEPEHWEEAVEEGTLPAEADDDEPSLAKWRRTLKAFAQSTHKLLNAAFGDEEVPSKPYQRKKKWFLQGEEISSEEAKERGAEAVNRATEIVTEWAESKNAEALNGCVMYAQCVYEENKKTGEKSEYPTFKYFSPEPPVRNGKPVEILTGDAIMNRPKPVEVTEVKSAGRASAKKKSTSKKRGKAA